MVPQRSIAREAAVRGVGLHGGRRVCAVLRPAVVNAGIVFRRTDLSPPAAIALRAENVTDTRLATTLAAGRAEVRTVEHLLAALAGLGLDNLLIDVDAAELPIMDGSAAPWALLIKSCGLVEQNAPKRFIRIKQPVEARLSGGRRARFAPAAACRYEIEIDFDYPVLRRSRRRLAFDLDAKRFLADIARARTFGYVRDVAALRRNRRALGGSFDNAVVFDDYRVLNEDGLRYPDEFVRHKMLDAIGDCYAHGAIVIGDYCAEKPGHEINNLLLRRLLATESAWEWVGGDQTAGFTPPAVFAPRPTVAAP